LATEGVLQQDPRRLDILAVTLPSLREPKLMNNAQKAKAAAAMEEEHLREPGIGAAMLAVLVMLLTTAVLFVLVYLVMVAITPMGVRGKQPAAPAIPAVQKDAAPTTVR